MQKIAIIGAGAWGTALAAVARRAGRDVRLWARTTRVAKAVNEHHENTFYLAGTPLDPAIVATNDMEEAAKDAEAVLLVTPAQHTRAIVIELAAHVPPSVPTLICSKGIEEGTGKLMSEVMAELAPGRAVGVLSGPTFAGEVARGLPTAITLATDAEGLGRTLVKALGSATFRPYWSPDVVGAQIGGAVKNVLAIACGIVEGRKLGDNARAALITRGLAEIVRLGLAKGARIETLYGLSGLGDLALTCTGVQSRNMSLGMALGAGETLEAILGKRNTVAEGVATAASVTALAERMTIEMPIASAVNAILHHGAAIDEAVAGLLARPFKAEGVDG
jgi:glycerol-3-phosphate dehydrogenase (NAD(P)+)